MSTPALKLGQIWREDDKRFERYIVITYVHNDGTPVFISCDQNGVRKPRARFSNAKSERFGRSGGYKFVREDAGQ